MQALSATFRLALVVVSTCEQALAQAPSASTPNPDLLEVYATLTHRTLLKANGLPKLDANLTQELIADTNRATAFIESELANHGIEVVREGEKFAKLMRKGSTDDRLKEQLTRIAPPRVDAGDIPGYSFSWHGADLDLVLTFYADLVRKTILRPSNLPRAVIHLQSQTPLTRAEAAYALKILLAFNHFAVIEDGDKFVQVVPLNQATRVEPRAPKSKAGAALIDPADIPTFGVERRTSRLIPPNPHHTPKTSSVTPELSREPYAPTAGSLLAFYGRLTNTSPIPSKQLDEFPVYFQIKSPVTKAELLYAIETTLAQSGLAIATRNSSVQIVPAGELRKPDAPATLHN